MRLLLIAIALAVPTMATAKETYIRCDVKVRMSGVIGTHSSEDITSRYYVINDNVRTIAQIMDGERKPVCGSDMQCDVKVSPDAAVVASESWPAGARLVGKIVIDRQTGLLNDTSQLYNRNGQPTIFTEVRGPCRPYAPEKRAF